MNIEHSLQLALQHHHAGRLGEAQAIYEQVLAQSPNQPDALHMLGVLVSQLGQTEKAVALIQRAVQCHPNFPQAYSNLGKLLRDLKQFEPAITACKRAIELQPIFPDAHFNLANALAGSGQFEASIAPYRRAIDLNPALALAHANLGNALAQLKRFDQAIAEFKTAIALQPQAAEFRNNLSIVYSNYSIALAAQDRFEETAAAARSAIELNPNNAPSHSNLGVALVELGQLQSAIAAFRRAIELDSSLAHAHWNLAQQLLLHGDFKAGWPEYEWRCKIKTLAPQSFSQVLWDGRDLTGQTILLHAEQGLGDTIQFIRYIPLVAARNAQTIIVQCQPSLAGLVRMNFPGMKIIPAGETLPPFDLHAPLLSLGFIFRTDLNFIPAAAPYLKPDARSIQDWPDRLASNSHFNVGLCWAGNPNHPRDRSRSIPLKQFAPLADCKYVRLHSLQIGARASEINTVPELNLIDQSAHLRDFADTAAFIANLDLVITVDTAVAHLAAAMAKPIWLLISQVPDWRWLLNRYDSPWYPTMRLFRQTKRGDWASVIQTVAVELEKTIASGKKIGHESHE